MITTILSVSSVITACLILEPGDQRNLQLQPDQDWYTAGLLAMADEKDLVVTGYSREHWIVFDWTWNLEGDSGSLLDRYQASQQHVEDLRSIIDATDHSSHPLPEGQLSRVQSALADLDIDDDGKFDLRVWIKNGIEIIEVPDVTVDGNSMVWGFSHYDSRINIEYTSGGQLNGEWIKQRGADLSKMVFKSLQDQRGVFYQDFVIGQDHRVFGRVDREECTVEKSKWSVEFEQSGKAVANFEMFFPKAKPNAQTDSPFRFFTPYAGLMGGTFLTPTGDFRYLSGTLSGVHDNFCGVGSPPNLKFQLSTFDGAHAFLFEASLQEGGSLKGDFYSGNWHHETWTAVRDDEAKLPDAFEQTVITDKEALAEAVFKDLEGEPRRVLDVLDESGSKARIIEIFGTWCPNCSDAGRELVSLKEKYGDDLGIVGLAFEITEDFERSAQQVRRHHEHIGTSWPILVAGLSDKDEATKTLGFLDQVRSYPTLVFLNDANEVQAVYSGFSGPATGEAYTQQRQRFEALIEGIIGE